MRKLPKYAKSIITPLTDADGERESLCVAFSHSRLDQINRPLLIVLVGGPGLAAIRPYNAFRKRASKAGFRVVMYEHRGIGYSRYTTTGAPIPLRGASLKCAAQDISAILDHLGENKAWILGSSYGTYLAQQFGAIAPERVAGMLLDSGFPAARYEFYIRRRNRRLFLSGAHPNFRKTAKMMRTLIAKGTLTNADTDCLFALYEWFGPTWFERFIVQLLHGAPIEYRWFRRVIGSALPEAAPYVWEPDRILPILTEETYPVRPDNLPLDRSLAFSRLFESHTGQGLKPFDFEAQLASFDWPAVLFSGEWDTRTPPEIMARMQRRLPHSLHVVFPSSGHEMIRQRSDAVLRIAYACATKGLDAASQVAYEEIEATAPTQVNRLFSKYLNLRASR